MLLASYAKINLFLEVLAKRPDQYHQIETLLCSVSLCDTIKYALTKNRGVKMWSNLPELVSDDNLIMKVALHLDHVFKPAMGVEMSLTKEIPIAAGLGGGSSNAAMTIKALDRLWNLNLSLDEQLQVAAMIGSDIAYFLYGGSCWATERGEIVTPVDDLYISNILLVNPNLKISSAKAYKLVRIDNPEKRMRFSHNDWRQTCFNRLEEGIRHEFPDVDEVISQLEKQGARPAMMSGSGSTCFGIFDDPQKLSASLEYFDSKGYWTRAVKTVPRKEYQSVFET